MIILFSPTKQMDFESPLSQTFLDMREEWSDPVFRDRALGLNAQLAGMGEEELRGLMKISPSLTDQTLKMITSFSEAQGRPALAAYSGTSFKALEPSSLDAASLIFAEKHLRILSGMYGLLRPLDRIAPYRLEMKTPLAAGGARSLSAFWKPLVGAALEGEAFVLNLASAEYSRTASLPKGMMTEIQFKEESGGRLKTVGMYAKQARGQMLRLILENRCAEADAVKALSPAGYGFRENLSSDACWVYTRSAG
jgi:cytoplasmic iron level regulating protein YaaA (DUF328/UPF0246 family)